MCSCRETASRVYKKSYEPSLTFRYSNTFYFIRISVYITLESLFGFGFQAIDTRFDFVFRVDQCVTLFDVSTIVILCSVNHHIPSIKQCHCPLPDISKFDITSLYNTLHYPNSFFSPICHPDIQ